MVGALGHLEQSFTDFSLVFLVDYGDQIVDLVQVSAQDDLTTGVVVERSPSMISDQYCVLASLMLDDMQQGLVRLVVGVSQHPVLLHQALTTRERQQTEPTCDRHAVQC